MSESLSGWLALREAADWAARSEMLVQRVRDVIAQTGTVSGLDLCTGTGSNLCYLMGRLPARQRWLVVDRDDALLEEVPGRLSRWAEAHGYSVRPNGRITDLRSDRFECQVETRPMNLERLDAEIFEGRHLVTASALLDLVSESWLRLLAGRCRAVGAAVLFTLTYDGRSACNPIEPEDDLVRELMNRHQMTDKGLGGSASGPQAWAVAERAFREAGYRVEGALSDWSLKPSEQRFQRELIEGWARAGSEIAPQHAETIADWLRRRLDHLAAGRSRIVVGHRDMVAWVEG
jgi:hypothetical protein